MDARHIGAALGTAWLGRGPLLRVLGEVESTQALLRAEALRGEAAAGTVVLASAQRAGRGRGTNRWVSPAGAGLYLSALLGSRLPAAEVSRITLAAAVAICEVLERLGLEPAIKWPNDVLLGGRKVAGVLCELLPDQGEPAGPAPGPRSVLVGVGLNVGPLPPSFPAPLRRAAPRLHPWLGGPAAGPP